MSTLVSRLSVLVVLVLCGLLMTTSALEARGTQLRNEDSSLQDIIEQRSDRGEDLQRIVSERRTSIEELEEAAAGGDIEAQQARSRADELAAAASTAEISGDGVTVTLDDGPREALEIEGTTPNDILIHQQDLEAVINALWRGGAEGVTVQDQRIVATSSVRCVGNTLRVNSRVYSPPYTISAVGDPAELQRALDESPALSVFREYVDRLGLGWKVEAGSVTLSAYEDALDVDQAKVKQ
ncbi:DUF881 domain-containing protein [Brevibacterium daeguense]|nr:DUF881 domain-containing protein [Brevibacterium daeguense]